MNRNKRTGRYTDSRLDKRCQCGHRLGEHTADRAGDCQPCLADGCACERFTKGKVPPPGKRWPVSSIESQIYIDTGELPDADAEVSN